MDFSKSLSLVERFHSLIPGGSHTVREGIDGYLESRPVQPVWRTFNEYHLG